MLIFPSIGGGVCSRSRRRQRQPNHGAGKRGGGTKPKPGATTGGRRRPDRPSCGLLNPPYCLRFLSLTSLVYASLQSKSAFSLQIRYRFLSLGVYFSLCFGGLVVCLPGHAVTLTLIGLRATVEAPATYPPRQPWLLSTFYFSEKNIFLKKYGKH